MGRNTTPASAAPIPRLASTSFRHNSGTLAPATSPSPIKIAIASVGPPLKANRQSQTGNRKSQISPSYPPSDLGFSGKREPFRPPDVDKEYLGAVRRRATIGKGLKTRK